VGEVGDDEAVAVDSTYPQYIDCPVEPLVNWGNTTLVVLDPAVPFATTTPHVDGTDVVKESTTSCGGNVKLEIDDEYVTETVDVPTAVTGAHQISSVMTPFTESLYCSARVHAPVSDDWTLETEILWEWILLSSTTTSPTF
jgi:hypothetical protein